MQNENLKFKVSNIKDKNLLKIATETIKKGGVITCPTDTVYGFLADASNKKAVEKIFKIKKRPKTKPLAIFVKDIKTAKEIAEIDKRQEKILKKHWPGKFTFVLGVRSGSDPRLTLLVMNKKTIAIRIPKHKFIQDLLKKINKPLSQTSVNISGMPEMKSVKEIIALFKKQKNKPDLIIDGGNLLKSKPSKIIDLTRRREKILRY
ncbi:MAG: L-threonylcarbamoyladenylate synthase [Patescibacteria group bacterium]